MFDGFIKCAAATPEVRVADCEYNGAQVMALIDKAYSEGVKIIVFPELCITAYTCQDLFFQTALINGALSALEKIIKHTEGLDMLITVGCPIMFRGELYNCGVVIKDGNILGIIPKKFLPEYNEFYEKRWFAPLPEGEYNVELFGRTVPFGEGLLFECKNMEGLAYGTEICEDLWAPYPPSVRLALAGATVIGNLSASNETISKSEYRKNLVKGQSARLISCYIYAGAGRGESTQDLVFGGDRIISENGVILRQGEIYTTGLTISETDISKLYGERHKNTSFMSGLEKGIRRVPFKFKISKTKLTRTVEKTPFVPKSPIEKDKRCEEILAMQAHALEKRVRHTNAKSLVIGISGGLDSCLALLVCAEAVKLLERPAKDITAVTMPCFGTTARTRSNAEKLCALLGTDLLTINITDSVKLHFRDIAHDENSRNVTYENSQARERTQVLMDIANERGGMVIGTGDLSELALGWATYNGDHMSMYGVNAGIPKTLVRHIVKYYADTADNFDLKEVLNAIFDTPVSPELLPADENGEISQKTEDLVGPYELHDFFLYNGIRWGFSPKKVFRLAKYAFEGEYADDVILKWLKTFYKRFFAQQFKRSCLPDGVKVGSVTLSPRGDWRMPSDACSTLWLTELEQL